MKDYLEAKACLDQALTIRKETYGDKQHPEVAETLRNLGDFYKATGEVAEAVMHYEQAMEIHKQVHREDHPEFIKTLKKLEEAKALV